MFNFIAFPIGYFFKFIYEFLAFNNYGIAIILLTVIVKSLLLPLYIKQYNAASKMKEVQPQIQEIQNKYKNDTQKLNEEILKLYKENKINPVGAFLPLLIQMPILFSVYYVISQPLKYMFGKTDFIIQQLYENIPENVYRISNMHDLSIINYFNDHSDKLSSVSDMLKKDELLNMNFLGINLGSVPTLNFHEININSLSLLLIPILAVITTYISIKYSTQQSSNTSTNSIEKSMQTSMNFIAPLMTGFISFSVPTGMGLYWIISNVFQILQTAFMNKFIIRKDFKLEPKYNEKKRIGNTIKEIVG